MVWGVGLSNSMPEESWKPSCMLGGDNPLQINGIFRCSGKHAQRRTAPASQHGLGGDAFSPPPPHAPAQKYPSLSDLLLGRDPYSQ